MAKDLSSFGVAVRVGGWLSLALLGLATPVGASGQTPELSQSLRELAATEKTNTMSLSQTTLGGRWGSGESVVERGPDIADGVSLWRVVAGSSSYLVVQTGDRIYRAGGFSGADTFGVAEQLMRHAPCADGPAALAGCLALALDLHGAVEVVVPYSADTAWKSRMALTEWKKVRPRDWPADTTLTGSGGDTSVVVVTIFSRNMGNFDQAWTAVAHSFTFHRGMLAAWSVRRGPTLAFQRR